MIDIQVNGKSLLLPRNFSIEWELNNWAFSDDLSDGDYSIPINLPVDGNEVAINFAHLLNTGDRQLVIDGAKCFENGNLKYAGKLAITRSRKKGNVKCSFIVTDLGVDIGETKLNELPLTPLVLGTNDTTFLASEVSSRDGGEMYCFPPIKGEGVFGDKDGAPDNVDINKSGTGVKVPWFFLTKLTEYIFSEIGYGVSGSFFTDRRFRHVVVSTMKTTENGLNEDNMQVSIDNVYNRNNGSFTTILGGDRISYARGPDRYTTEIKQDIPMQIGFQLELEDVELNNDPYSLTQRFLEAEVRFFIDSSLLGISGNKKIIASGRLGSPGVAIGDISGNINRKVSINYNPLASEVGWYVFVEIRVGIVTYQREINNFSGFNNYTATGVRLLELYESSCSFSIDYMGAGGYGDYNPVLDFNYFMPTATVGTFLNALKNDFGLRIGFHPFNKEVKIDVAQDLLNSKVVSIDNKVRDDYEIGLEKVSDGVTFVQDFDDYKADQDKEDELELRVYLGEFEGVSNFPTAVYNSYVLDTITNAYYLSEPDGTGSVYSGWTFTHSWVYSHHNVPKTTYGSGGTERKVMFNPMRTINDGSNFRMLFTSLVGSRKYSTKSSVSFFRIANFFPREDSTSLPYGTSTNVNAAGTVGEAFVLNYDVNNQHSLFNQLHRQWINFLMNAEEVEVEYVDFEQEESIDMDTIKKLDSNLFLVKQVRIKNSLTGDRKAEATLIRINGN